MGDKDSNGKQPNKFDQAVARSRDRAQGADLAENAPNQATTVPRELVIPVGFDGGSVGLATINEIQRDITERGWESAPHLYAIEEGTFIHGILEGEGPPAEFMDSRTGEVRDVKTWIIRSLTAGFRVSILSSAQLDRKLPPFVGGEVKIFRGRPIRLRNSPGHVTDYAVTGPKIAHERNFAQLPAPRDAANSNVTPSVES